MEKLLHGADLNRIKGKRASWHFGWMRAKTTKVVVSREGMTEEETGCEKKRHYREEGSS